MSITIQKLLLLMILGFQTPRLGELLETFIGCLFVSSSKVTLCPLRRPSGIYGVPMSYERSFRWKICQFRYLCQSNALPSHIKLTVSRTTLFEDSYHQIMRHPAYELRRRLYIIFRGEEGLDYGGVARYLTNFTFNLMIRSFNCTFCFLGSGFSCCRTKC